MCGGALGLEIFSSAGGRKMRAGEGVFLVSNAKSASSLGARLIQEVWEILILGGGGQLQMGGGKVYSFCLGGGGKSEGVGCYDFPDFPWWGDVGASKNSLIREELD